MITERPNTDPKAGIDKLFQSLKDRPDLQETLIPGISLAQELSPELFRRAITIASEYNQKINCHGTSLYLAGLTKNPIEVSPVTEIFDYLKQMRLNTELLPGSLVCYTASPDVGRKYVPHSGILLLSKNGEQLILHKGSYENPIKIETIDKALGLREITEGAGELESYSLK